MAVVAWGTGPGVPSGRRVLPWSASMAPPRYTLFGFVGSGLVARQSRNHRPCILCGPPNAMKDDYNPLELTREKEVVSQGAQIFINTTRTTYANQPSRPPIEDMGASSAVYGQCDLSLGKRLLEAHPLSSQTVTGPWKTSATSGVLALPLKTLATAHFLDIFCLRLLCLSV